jgi:hypothetical protein
MTRLCAVVLLLSCFPTEARAEPAGATAKAVVKRALASKMDAIANCGSQVTGKGVRALASFEIDPHGKARNVRVEGLAEFRGARECLISQLADVRVPAEMALLIQKVRLPLAIK